MLAITLTEPWASLVACGAKQVETRSWSTDYRGPIAIHAAKGITGDDLDSAMDNPAICDALEACGRVGHYGYRPKVKDAFRDTRGCVLAVTRLVRVVRTVDVVSEAFGDYTSRSHHPSGLVVPLGEIRMGNYAPGRFAWLLADVRKLPEPIPATGALGLWQWDPPAGVR